MILATTDEKRVKFYDLRLTINELRLKVFAARHASYNNPGTDNSSFVLSLESCIFPFPFPLSSLTFYLSPVFPYNPSPNIKQFQERIDENFGF